jgi:oligopeptide/dipeptide ABC transporter ATP-binding protein
MDSSRPLIQVENLRMSFALRNGTVTAVDDVSFRIPRGRIVGLVGESGCGKSVTGRSLLRIEAPAAIESGEIIFSPSGNGDVRLHLLSPDSEAIRSIRWKQISMVFQEPMASLGPMHTIGDQIQEAVRLHLKADKKEAERLAIDALSSVGMPRPEQVFRQYPHQMSGGMRQRAMIAMALSCTPGLLIADEPTTALDASTESQILDLLKERRKNLDMSILYITHNMAVIAQIAEEVLVMYLGRIVESASVRGLFAEPKHPYTRALMNSIPRIDRNPAGRLEAIEGDVPDPYTRPAGCAFHPRCPQFIAGVCDRMVPEMTRQGRESRVACHLYPESLKIEEG